MSSMRRGHLRRQASVDYPRYPPANSTTQQPPPETLAMLASDYDSEAQEHVLEYPAALPPIDRTREELNLSVIQRHNGEIVDILSVAPHATVYDLGHTPAPGWQKSGVEGALFICRLTPGQFHEERFHAFVLNRGGLNNFEAELRQSDPGGVEILQDYVIISRLVGGERKVNGIYIFSGGPGTSTESSRAANGELMRDLAIAAQRSRTAAELHLSETHASRTSNVYHDPVTQLHSQPFIIPHRPQSPPSPRDADDTDENMLLQMLQQATNKQTTAPTSATTRSANNGAAETLMNALRQAPVEPGRSPVPQVAPVPTRKVDLLALFQGNVSDTEGGMRANINTQPVEPQHTLSNTSMHVMPTQGNPRPPNNDLLNLFRGAGLA